MIEPCRKYLITDGLKDFSAIQPNGQTELEVNG
jgi:hypothetical protein